MAGSFNDWVPQRGPMSDDDGDGVWEARFDLDPGRYPYKFVVHGSTGDTWFLDPEARERVDDGQGGMNGVLVVPPRKDFGPHRLGDDRIDEAALEHEAALPWVDRDRRDRLFLRLATARHDLTSCLVEVEQGTGQGLRVPMRVDEATRRKLRWVARLPMTPGRYRFHLHDGAREWVGPWRELDPGSIPRFSPPSWVGNGIFYGIFPDRFRNGEKGNDPDGVRPWGEAPSWDSSFGGDLEGVRQALPYLSWLGVDGIYLNPIFDSLSNHRYDTRSYERVDAELGGETSFRSLLRDWHGQGGRVLLDGAFNHTADEHAFFVDVRKRGQASPWWDWYRIFRWPVVTKPRPSYDCWWGFGDLPRLRTDRRPVQDHLLGVARRWTPLVDGWRLDAAEQVDDGFWRRFRSAVKGGMPSAWLVGEIWSDARPWLRGDMFDSVMAYPLQKALVRFFARGEGTASELGETLAELRFRHPPHVLRAAMTFLSSHDTKRFRTEAGGDLSRLHQALAFLLAYPGAPMLFYGDELGFQGGKDPANRPCMRWDPDPRDDSTARLVRRLVARRRADPALRFERLRLHPAELRSRCFCLERLRPRGDGATLVFFNGEGEAWQPKPRLSGKGDPTPSVPVLPAGAWHHLSLEGPWPEFRVESLR